MGSKSSARWCRVATAFALTAVPGFASADDSDPVAAQEVVDAAPAEAPEKSGLKNRMIEEVIVTAQKREENLQSVPISVSAFSGAALEARGITDPKELQLATPGLNYGELVGYSLIYMRGVGSDAFVPTADTSVATYIDGVYFPFLHGLSQSLGAVQRIEVLKGPQGTLFGRNSTGGAINIITKDPDNQFHATAEASYETYDSAKSRFFVSGPLSDTLSVSVSAVVNDAQKDLYTPGPTSVQRDFPGNKTRGGNIKLLWHPWESGQATLSTYAIKSEASGSAILTMQDPSTLGTALGIPAQPENYQANTNRRDFVDVDFRVGTLTLRQDFDWFSVKTISAYQDLVTFAQNDFDGSAKDVISFAAFQQFARVHTEELQFISPEDSGKFKWIGGLYYIASQAGYHPVQIHALNEDDPTANLGIPLGQFTSALNAAGIPLPTPGAREDVYGSVHTTSYSGFAQGTYSFLDWLGLTLGGRYQWEKRSIADAHLQVVAPDTPTGIPITATQYPKEQFTVTNFSPKATVDFHANDETLLYLSYSQGFKSGTYNPINLIAPPGKVDPEKVTTYEAGVKGTFLDGTLRINGAVFQNTIDNVQVLVFSLTSGGIVSLENAAQARIRGGEIDVTWSTPVSGLALFASGSHLDGEYTRYNNASGFTPFDGPLPHGLFEQHAFDFTGHTTVRTPKWTSNAGFNYLFEIPGGNLELSTDVYYNSGFNYDAAGYLPEKAYYLLNAHVTYSYEPAKLKFTFFAKNLTDQLYTYARYENDFGKLESLAPGRVVGARINWEF